MSRIENSMGRRAARRWFSRLALAVFMTLLAAALSHDPFLNAAQRDEPLPARTAGSATLLPGGQELLVGGVEAGAPTDSAAIRDQKTGAITQPAGHLEYARAWHTATVLPDGSVAVIGGVGPGGPTVDVVERFDPGSQTFSKAAVNGITARHSHTATLLGDGEVVIVGGISSSGETLESAQLWDPRSNRVTAPPAGLRWPRSAHSATLLADGRVLIEGGVDSGGRRIFAREAYDPQLQEFVPFDSERPGGASNEAAAAVSVAATTPKAGAADVAIDTIISMRFSAPVRVETVNSATVSLESRSGAVGATAVAAESGMLAFVNPAAPLAPGTTYRVKVTGVLACNGTEVQPAGFSFTTTARAAGAAGANGGSKVHLPGTSSFGLSTGMWRPTSDWRTNGPSSSWQSLPPLRAPAGVTALSGQVLTTDGSPLPGVTLAVGGNQTLSDSAGRFLIMGPLPARSVLLIDGTSADREGQTYGIFEAAVLIEPNLTNILPFTVWMPVLDTAHAITIASPTVGETIVSNPLLPGLELRIPAGTIITGIHGEIVRSITITPVPLDRPPFALPAGVDVPIYFTIQPGGAQLRTTKGAWSLAQLLYPNLDHLPPAAPFDFWNYEADDAGWYVYGRGSVSSDGSRIIPDPGVGIYEFTGAMVGNPPAPPSTGPGPGNGGCDPVDCSSGLFRHSETDLFLSDVLPINFTRTYVSQDNFSRPFGLGTTDNYEIFLVGHAFPYTFINLILDDGERVAYTNINPDQSGFDAAFYVPTLSPSSLYYGSTISWDSQHSHWHLRLRDGTTYTFPEYLGSTNPSAAALDGIIDRHGNTITFTRDANSTLTGITTTNGRFIKLTHDAGNRITQITDDMGRTVKYTYDVNSGIICNAQKLAVGLLCAVTDANGEVTRYFYDSGNRMTRIVDPRGVTATTNTYDPTSERVSVQTLADGSTYRFAYTLDAKGRVSTSRITNPRGIVEAKAFDSTTGLLTADTYATGVAGVQETFTYAYDPSTKLVVSATDQLGRKTCFSYDSSGNLTSVTRLCGTAGAVATSATYEEPNFSQITSFTDENGHTWTMGYNSTGDLVSVTDPLGHPDREGYNSLGQLTSFTDALNNTTSFAYNNGDLSTVTDPLGNTFRFFADGAGRLISQVDALGNITRLVHDNLDRPTQLIDANGGVSSVAYDGNGNMSTAIDARGNKTSFQYDSRNRLIKRTDPQAAAQTYAYDANSNLTTYTDRRGKVTAYSYDAMDRQTFAGFGHSGAVYESTIKYTWDGGNRLTGATDSLAGAIGLSWDGLDRMTGLHTPQGTVGYVYDKAGRRTAMSVPGQPQVNYGWDIGNRLTAITQGTSPVKFTFDNDNRRTVLTLPNGIQATYTYDHDSRVTAITWTHAGTQIGNLTYAYDAQGRITGRNGTLNRVNLPAPVAGNAFNASNAMTKFGAAALSYDANGNLINDGTKIYAWDARNNLTAISGAATAKFRYDALGHRSASTFGAKTTQFLQDMGLNPVQELNGANPPAATANLLTGRNIDEYFTRADSGGTATFLSDALGSTLALGSSTGAIQTTYAYEPFGQTTVTGTNPNPYQFSGRQNDGTGLYFFRDRYYSPLLGRFISQDALGLLGGVGNLYEFVEDDPINLIDPTGDCPTCGAALLGAAAGAAIGGGIAYASGGDWKDGAIQGAIVGGVSGLTLGLAGPSVAGFFGGGWLGGAAAGALSGAVGNLAGQGYENAVGNQCGVNWTNVGLAAAGGALAGGILARPATAASQRVTSWAPKGTTPDLNSGRWVMTGGPGYRNWGLSGTGYPQGNSASGVVPGSQLSYPPGWEGFKGYFGQRIIQ